MRKRRLGEPFWRVPLAAAILALCGSCAGLFAEEDGRGEEVAPRDGAERKEERDNGKPGEPAVIEVIVTASRTPAPYTDSSRSVTVIGEKRLAERGSASILDVLSDQPGVWLEKRNSTNTNLILRGFGGANNLALVDGDTLTTLWGEGGEGGDDLYGKVETESVKQVEVVRGPASVLYGSNCLGGVVNFIARKCPYDYTDGEEFKVGGRAKASFESASEGYFGRGEVYGASSKVRWFLGGGARNASDTRSGGGRYLKPTGGESKHLDAALEFKLAQEHVLELTYQHMDIDHLYRYYRPTQLNANDRDAGHLLYRWRPPAGPVREVQAKAYLQRKKDRRFWDDGSRGRALWETLVLSSQVELGFDQDRRRLVAGLNYEVDWGESPDDEQFTIRAPGGQRAKAAPDTEWYDSAAFVLYEWKPLDDLTLSVSARGDYFEFISNSDRYYVPAAPGYDPENDELSAYNTILSGGAGLVYRVLHDPDVRLFANISRGYRLYPPVFGLTQHGQGIRAPSGMLDPITGDQFEFGTRNESSHLRGSLAGYYSAFAHFQTMTPGAFAGSDWFDWNQDGNRDPDESILVTSDGGGAYLMGLELMQEARIDHFLRLPCRIWVGAGFAWNYGEQESGAPIRFTHPPWGLAKIRWEQGRMLQDGWISGLYLEYEARIVGDYERIPRDYLLGDRGYRVDPQDASSPLLRPFGLPGYTVHDLRIGFTVKDRWGISLNVENLGDKKYRQAHSRWDESGRNVLFCAQFAW
ncbi:MAG: TonB-dependent receptor [Planctomycetota bacterium]|nr:TonB-dependent receptor [Planctomycetota bacterium]